MHKSGALGRQLYPPPKSPSPLLRLNHDAFTWFTLCLLSSFFGYLYEQYFLESPLSFIKSSNLNQLTGPSLYFEYFWLYYFLFKSLSSYLIYNKYHSFLLTKDKTLKDLAIIVAFFIEYRIIKYIFLHYQFKVSGHCLLLVLGSFVIDTEGMLSLKLIETKGVVYISKIILGFHYYFGSWTAFGYHTVFESVAGLVVGFLTIVAINKVLSR